MLQPKRTKYRKQQKGKNRGLALRGSSVSFGEYGLKATGRGRLTARQIEAARRAMTRYVKDPARQGAVRNGRRGGGSGPRGVPAGGGETADRHYFCEAAGDVMKASELRNMSAGDLREELLKLRREQFNLRMQRATGQMARPDQFGKVRKDIARVKTVLKEMEAKRPEGEAR